MAREATAVKVIVTGGTGFIGKALIDSLLKEGAPATVFTRSAQPRIPAGVESIVWSEAHRRWRKALDGADAVVHLAGESIADGRWSPARKKRIRDSRVAGTRMLVEALAECRRKPPVLVSCSAVGYYGPCGDERLDETAKPGTDFLAGVCTAWEREAARAAELGMRVVCLRNGLVLGRDGGALPRMLLPFHFFVGGPIGSGRQWMSWIHRADLVRLIRFVMEEESVEGAVNAVAPNPVTNREFSRTIGRVMRRPSVFPVPAFALRLVFGEMAQALLLSGQRAVPARALEAGFRFNYPELEPALKAVLR